MNAQVKTLFTHHSHQLNFQTTHSQPIKQKTGAEAHTNYYIFKLLTLNEKNYQQLWQEIVAYYPKDLHPFLQQIKLNQIDIFAFSDKLDKLQSISNRNKIRSLSPQSIEVIRPLFSFCHKYDDIQKNIKNIHEILSFQHKTSPSSQADLANKLVSLKHKLHGLEQQLAFVYSPPNIEFIKHMRANIANQIRLCTFIQKTLNQFTPCRNIWLKAYSYLTPKFQRTHFCQALQSLSNEIRNHSLLDCYKDYYGINDNDQAISKILHDMYRFFSPIDKSDKSFQRSQLQQAQLDSLASAFSQAPSQYGLDNEQEIKAKKLGSIIQSFIPTDRASNISTASITNRNDKQHDNIVEKVLGIKGNKPLSTFYARFIKPILSWFVNIFSISNLQNNTNTAANTQTKSPPETCEQQITLDSPSVAISYLIDPSKSQHAETDTTNIKTPIPTVKKLRANILLENTAYPNVKTNYFEASLFLILPQIFQALEKFHQDINSLNNTNVNSWEKLKQYHVALTKLTNHITKFNICEDQGRKIMEFKVNLYQELDQVEKRLADLNPARLKPRQGDTVKLDKRSFSAPVLRNAM